ncbi:hypothetical protein ABZT51_46090 [Streptomyces sp. NPDC005373]|uniref:hypothetical protein n=1 Tax=Streptomyces sp. NPDC005373 TaxID=3156879 RepID=UPI0033B267B4
MSPSRWASPRPSVTATAAVRTVITGGVVHKVSDLVADATAPKAVASDIRSSVHPATATDVPQSPALERHLVAPA